MQSFNQLTGGAASSTAETERYLALVGVALVGIALGAALGYAINRPQ
jgi:hypothetical protein